MPNEKQSLGTGEGIGKETREGNGEGRTRKGARRGEKGKRAKERRRWC